MTQRMRDLVVLGASAGGVQPLIALVGTLPADLPAAVFVVLHLPPEGGSTLASILDRAGPLDARLAEDGEPIEHGRIYVARPDCTSRWMAWCTCSGGPGRIATALRSTSSFARRRATTEPG